MKHFTFSTIFLLSAILLFAQKEIESLNRGLIAFNKNGTVYLNWRLFALEDYSVGFNVYRSVNGGNFSKINTKEITETTDFLDNVANVANSNTYYVVPIVNGKEQEASETFTLEANTPVRQYFPIALEAIPGKSFTDYNVLHVYPGDFDGDGDFDYLVKRFPTDTRYNTILLDCYDNEGTFKWRIDLGPNVETYISSMTAPVLVADFDSDGKAEIIAKTGEQTIFGNGYTIPDTDGDRKTDYNGHEGLGNAANVMSGPEFLSYIDGETGEELDRNNFLSRRNPYTDWGDSYGARMNFMMSSVGYFDGVHPACVFSRGDGADMDVDAWQIVNGKLTQIWYYTARGKTYSVGGWTDFHQVQCIDVDGDGKDETSWGACMLDDDGSLLYTTKYCHGDRFQITDINPNRPGLEVFIIQQYNTSLIGSALYDAATGQTIKDWYIPAKGDIGRGDAADIDPTSPGIELFDTGNENLHASDGTEITASHPYPAVSIYWDGDLLRETLFGVGNGGYNPAINKWNYIDNKEERLFSIYSDGGSYIVKSPYGGRVPLVGDILGDWREEIFLETGDRETLRIYSSYTPSEARLYTLMQNPSYRTAITTKGYLCSKYPDYFLGANMSTPPQPNIKLVGEKDCNGTLGGSAYTDGCDRCVGGTTGIYECYSLEEGYYNIKTFTNSLYLSSTDDFTQQTFVEYEKTLIWLVEKSGSDYTFFSIAENAYLSYDTPADGSDLGFGKTYTQFSLEKTTNGTIMVIPSENSDFVLDVPSCQATVGLTMNFWTRFNNDCQAFIFEKAETLYDCAGKWGGTAYIDECGTCVGGLTGKKACIALQAEHACSYDGIEETEHAGFYGDCYINLNNQKETALSFKLWSATNQTVSIIVRFANGDIISRPANISVNGTQQITEQDFPPTGDWKTWKEQTVQVSLAFGENTIELISTTEKGGVNYDFFYFEPESLLRISCEDQTTKFETKLEPGWNLFSTNVIPQDNAIATLFNGIDVACIKAQDGFWRADQPTFLNSLATIIPGEGYLLYLQDSALLQINGLSYREQANTSSHSGWNLVGVSYQIITPFSDVFDTSNCQIIKNFDGFWKPDEGIYGIDSLEPGKAYFIFK